MLRWPCFRQHGAVAADQPAMQATRQRVHCVLLIVQPLECADDAGFTLVQSHCCTLHSGPVRLSCSPSYFYTLYFCKFVSYAKFLGTTATAAAGVLSRTLVGKCGHASNRWMSQCACGELTYISHKFSQVQGERKSSQMKKGKREGEIWEWKKPLCVCQACSQTVQVPKREAIEAGASGTEKNINSHLVCEWKHREKLG